MVDIIRAIIGIEDRIIGCITGIANPLGPGIDYNFDSFFIGKY